MKNLFVAHLAHDWQCVYLNALALLPNTYLDWFRVIAVNWHKIKWKSALQCICFCRILICLICSIELSFPLSLSSLLLFFGCSMLCHWQADIYCPLKWESQCKQQDHSYGNNIELTYSQSKGQTTTNTTWKNVASTENYCNNVFSIDSTWIAPGFYVL